MVIAQFKYHVLIGTSTKTDHEINLFIILLFRW